MINQCQCPWFYESDERPDLMVELSRPVSVYQWVRQSTASSPVHNPSSLAFRIPMRACPPFCVEGYRAVLTHFALPQPVHFPGLSERCTDAPRKQYISGPRTHLLSVLCVCDENSFICQCQNKQTKDWKQTTEIRVSHFALTHSLWFASDIMAVKGLIHGHLYLCLSACLCLLLSLSLPPSLCLSVSVSAQSLCLCFPLSLPLSPSLPPPPPPPLSLSFYVHGLLKGPVGGAVSQCLDHTGSVSAWTDSIVWALSTPLRPEKPTSHAEVEICKL